MLFSVTGLLVVLYCVAVFHKSAVSSYYLRAQSAVQVWCGVCALLFPLPLCCVGCRIQDGSTPADRVLRDIEEENEAVDYALEPVETWHTVERARERNAVQYEPAPALRSRTAPCRVYFAASAYGIAAVLTAIPEVISTPASAFILYSTVSRVLELALATQCLQASRLRQGREGEPSAVLKAPHSTDTADTVPRSSPPASSRTLSRESWQGAQVEPVGPVRADSTAAPVVNFWKKPWAWVFTPEAGTPLARLVWNSPAGSTQETREVAAGEERYVHVKHRSSNSSSGDEYTNSTDSTDSGREYFI
jgi:hypothetical protein